MFGSFVYILVATIIVGTFFSYILQLVFHFNVKVNSKKELYAINKFLHLTSFSKYKSHYRKYKVKMIWDQWVSRRGKLKQTLSL